MTTYLATRRATPGTAEFKNPDDITEPFCSKDCALDGQLKYGPSVDYEYWIHWTDSYEFDETCANCGSLIKASK